MNNDKNIENSLKDINDGKKLTCYSLFGEVEIDDMGQAFFCCEHRVKGLSIGNIYKSDFYNIWNSELAVNIREKALKNEYPYCNSKICHKFVNDINKHFCLITDNFKPVMESFPTRVGLPLDVECNARCIFCRDKYKKTSDEDYNKLINNLNNIYLPILKDAVCVTVNAMGDAFAGRFSREFIKTVSQKLPNVKFRIMTNGILATKEIIQELNIEDKIEELDISVNAVKASTHRKIFRTNTAAFKQLLKNLEYLSSLKVSDFTLNFVICNYNYKEMKKFVKFCQKYNAKASFWEVRDYFHDMLETKYEDIAVHLPAHKNHKKFKKLLSSKVFDNTQIILSPIIKEIRSEAVEETKNSLWNKLFRGRIFG